MSIVSRSEYARRRGVDPGLITRWAKAGRLVLDADGNRVDAEASDALLAETLDPARGGRGGGSGGPKLPLAPAQQRPAPSPQADTYTRVRTHREAFRAKTEEVEYREKIGELVERAVYDNALADGLGPILAALDSLSARLGPALAAENDVRRVQNLIDDAVTVIRQDMADTLRRMVAGVGTRQ